jgi:mono/diheme cytochrome c family protein
MTERRPFAVLGLFDGAQHLLDAAKRLAPRKLGHLEAYTPYPVHGVDEVLGGRKSPLAGMTLVAGILGAISAMVFEWWTSAVDYSLITGGKAPFSWQAFVPIMFEVTVLFATFTAGLGMLHLLARLPFFGHPLHGTKAMAAITRDRFALAVEADGATLDVDAAKTALAEAGARDIEILSVPAERGPLPLRFVWRSALGIAIACATAGYAAYWGVKLVPVVSPIVHMLEQPRLDAQKGSAFFPDGHGMRPPVPGTVDREHAPYPFATQDAANVLVNPLPRDPSVLRLGRKTYENHCIVCHGALGTGVPTLTAAYGAKPANLQSRAIREYADGQIYHVIVRGKNAMPSYAADLSEDERWTVIHYVRVLQRAQNANDEDLR